MRTAFGLLDSETYADTRFKNWRREVLHSFPQGAAPITGLLSMIGDEVTSDPEFNWHEKRFPQRRAKLRGNNPITTTEPTSATTNDGEFIPDGTSKDTDDDLWIKLDRADKFNKNLIVQVETVSSMFRVLDVVFDSTNGVGYVKVRLLRDYEFVSGDRDADTVIRIISSAHIEGGSGEYGGVGYLPQVVMNSTQIERTEFEFTGTAAKTEMKFDESGPYRERARDAYIEHMTRLEKNIIFGQRSLKMAPDHRAGGRIRPLRTMSGIIEFLRLWDAGSDGLSINGTTYAPYSDHDAATNVTDDLKRIIPLPNGNLTKKFWNELVERVGRYHSNKTNEKLVLCGSGAMMVFNELFERNTTTQVEVGAEAYGLRFTRYVTPFGDYWFKSHPLFNDDPLWRNWALIIDIHSLKWRYMPGRDTTLLEHRQLPDEDLRRDEYLTEAGIEMWLPEGNMLIQDVKNYVH